MYMMALPVPAFAVVWNTTLRRMPLPTSSKPNETTRIPLHPRQSSLPKRAIVVRLNPEALNALNSFPAQPQVDIDLNNDSPGLHIGKSFFPVRFQKEEISHEIYIRAATANKLNAPLRCHANVVGKLSLTDRELDPGTEARIKMATKDAREQRDAPKTKYIDTPSDLPQHANSKTRKKDSTSMWRKPVKPSDQPRLSAFVNPSTIASHTRTSHLLSSSQMSAEIVALRKQIIHYLARSDFEPSVDDVLRAVGPEECDPVTRREINDALGEVAEQNAKRLWSLKPHSWLEVRPYEWPTLSESERLQMARKGRLILANLGVSESDPAWVHVKFRNNKSAVAPIATTSTQSANGQSTVVPKRGISSKEVKEKKTRSIKMETKNVLVKDEGGTAKGSKPATSSTLSPLPASHLTTSTSVPKKRTTLVASVAAEMPTRSSPTSRKPPGSGFKLKASDSPRRSDSLSQDGSPAPSGHSVRVKSDAGRNPERASVSSNVRLERHDGNDAAPLKRVKRLKGEAGVESERDYDMHDRERDRGREQRRETGSEKERKGGRDHYRERERERDPGREIGLELERTLERENEKDKERTREKNKNQRLPSASTVAKESCTLKRKKPLARGGDGDDDSWSGRSSSKKQRFTNDEQRSTHALTNGGEHAQKSGDRPQKLVKSPKDILTSHKQLADSTPSPLVVKKETIKKESSPLGQLPKIKKESSPMPSVHKASSTHKSHSKSRRKSPIYTSSEDEDKSAIADTKPGVDSVSTRNHTVMPAPPLPIPVPHFQPSRNTASSSGVTLPTSNGRLTPPLPSDHAGLRARYRSSYLEYLDTFRTAMTQKSKIENLLQHYGEGSVASFTDSDGEELLDYDRLTHVVGETKRMWDELQGIQQAYGMTPARS
ncbi:hypothetical protein E1B28_000781 [Marasmius oreades]|uniref:RNA polymerase II elongation factor ELL N-terminal domain-containing protein n=1 Tax=Marasmius oreades TaxID=181124 RepID=A0A9P7V250_9AGAR|nr:uncharacterized protein E1B28_000781 [Marasmius oreades]KAG7098881.1 hypothetical protein E1B28_000781 [Marasmius oreades]